MGKGTYANSLGLSGSLSDTALISHSLPYGSPNLLDKMDFWAFLCLSLKFSQFYFFSNFFFIHCTVPGTFLHFSFSHWQRLFCLYNLIVCISYKTSYNVLSHSGGIREGVAGGWHLGTIKRASRFKISRGWHLWKWGGGGGECSSIFYKQHTCRKKGLNEKSITLYTVSYAMKTRVRWHKKIEMFSTIKIIFCEKTIHTPFPVNESLSSQFLFFRLTVTNNQSGYFSYCTHYYGENRKIPLHAG